MRRVKISLGVMAATAAAVGLMLLLPGMTMSSLPTESPARVQLTPVLRGEVEQMIAVSGHIRYESEYAALSPVTGIVEKVYVRAGDAVAAGQALFRLDASAEEAALSAAYASQAGMEASAVQALAALAEEADVGALTSAASVASTQETQARLSAMTVRAQADGQVLQVSVSERGGVMAGTAAVLLSDTKQRIVCTAVVRDAERVQQGQRARILSGGVTACMATVREVGPAQTDSLTGQTVSEIILTPDENLSLPLGAPVDAEIILAGQSGVPVLPVTALTEAGTVWWAAEGRCWEMPVTVALQDELYAWVSLPEGVQVIDHPGALLEGQRIREVKP